MSDPVGDYIALLARDAERRKRRMLVVERIVEAAMDQPKPTPALRAALEDL